VRIKKKHDFYPHLSIKKEYGPMLWLNPEGDIISKHSQWPERNGTKSMNEDMA